MKAEVLALGKLKFDLRDSDESSFAQHELSSILGTKVEPIKNLSMHSTALYQEFITATDK